MNKLYITYYKILLYEFCYRGLLFPRSRYTLLRENIIKLYFITFRQLELWEDNFLYVILDWVYSAINLLWFLLLNQMFF